MPSFKSYLLRSVTATAAFALVASSTSAFAKDKEDAWDVNNPPGAKKQISINVSEGTWMSLDVSPDGQTLAFDLLGDIYTMPITGGTARNIASGMAWEMQPRFSPDGTKIAFTSDRAGGDNIWTMNVDGSDMKQVTKEDFRLTNNPTWSPDGNFIAARKHFTTSRSLGVGEIWLYHTSGGSGVQLVKKPSEAHQKELGEPMFSTDGKYVYYSQNVTSGPIFEYAQNSHTELFQIKRYDMESGEITTAAGGNGGAVRPAPSPNGQHLAFVKRVNTKSKLFLKDLTSGAERIIYDDLDQDMQETWAVQGVYPNMDWAPDSSALYFWSGGKIHSVNIATGSVQNIPFTVRDTRSVMRAPRPSVEVAPAQVQSKMPRFTQVSPDGSQVVFESLGKIYIRPRAGGTATRLTTLDMDVRELFPSWSGDGQRVVFTTWTDGDLGAIHSVDTNTRNITKLTQQPGHYKRPRLSPNGMYLVYETGSGGYLTAPEWSSETGLHVMNLTDGTTTHMRNSGSDPHFTDAQDRIYFTDNSDKKNALISTNLAGDDERVHASSKLAQTFFMSPDGQQIAFRENYNLYVTPALIGPQNVATGPSAKALPVTKVSEGGSTYPNWSRDGKLWWTLGPKLFSVDTASVMEEGFKPPTTGTTLSHTVPADIAQGQIALTGARIITMSDKDGGIIENGTIIIENNRIKSIGANVSIPDGVNTVDLQGKTIIPGLIDAHAHGPQGTDELIPQQNWKAISHLALGVTTVFDPSSQASEIFVASEMQRAGRLLAPRTFSTGEVIYGAKAPGFFANIQSESDAQEHVGRLKNQGAHGVKNYNQPRRDQRQQVVKAARDKNLITVAEGGSLYHMDMSMVADGNTSIEHNLPVLEVYDDVVQMYSQTNVAYTPTLVVTYGGVRGEDYYYQTTDVFDHPILSKHAPIDQLRARGARRQMAPLEDYADDDSAAVSKKLADAGVLVSIGAHGQREGLASHWELWSFVRGGMSPVEALRTGTSAPAEHLGFDKDIGSLERGKLADLLILSANPLDDIHNTDDIEHVMIGGRLYDAQTMNEVHTGDKMRKPYWWE